MISIKDIISRRDEVKKIATWALKDMRGYVSRVVGNGSVKPRWVEAGTKPCSLVGTF